MTVTQAFARVTPAFLFAGLMLLSFSGSARPLPDFTELVEANSAAVVNISTSQKRRQSAQRPQLPKGFEIPDLPEDSPFNEFFRRFFGDGEMEEFNTQSLGSGFIISSDGYVISNNHVIKDADEIVVRLSDRREFVAKVIGSDDRSDIALLKIDATNLPVVTLGDSQNLKVGEWVLAIGSPFGFEHSATAGIVSAKGRSLPRENYVPFIQTDVAINPGNSGGPLFNLDGEVVGVNSQIFSRTGGFMGLSFAIPIKVAMNVASQLKEKGRVSRGWLGVLIQDVTRELAESFGMGKPEGALIAKVLPESPAEKAGFQVGDIVLEFGGRYVNRSSELPPIVGSTQVGERVPVRILREGKSKTLTVLIAELPEEDELKLATSEQEGGAKADKLGLTVIDLTSEQREKQDVKENGVLVENVSPGPASRAGVKKGDIILMLNNTKVKDSAHFKELAKDLPQDKAVSVLVQRQGNPIFLALKADE
ncbi:MAG: DegQ family serine endoprotease [Gammaproteobacteria bacterium]|nr:DegQ family serine endoprotease [Gammaproteobacteria bacterium]